MRCARGTCNSQLVVLRAVRMHLHNLLRCWRSDYVWVRGSACRARATLLSVVCLSSTIQRASAGNRVGADRLLPANKPERGVQLQRRQRDLDRAVAASAGLIHALGRKGYAGWRRRGREGRCGVLVCRPAGRAVADDADLPLAGLGAMDAEDRL